MEGSIFRERCLESTRRNPESPSPARVPSHPRLSLPYSSTLPHTQASSVLRSADPSQRWTNLWGEGQAAGEDDTPLTLLIHPGLSLLTPSSVKPQPSSLNLSPGPWDIQAARPHREARCLCAAALPSLSASHYSSIQALQIKASSHMKCFWGLKLNYTTRATTAATITDPAVTDQ